MIKCFHSLLKNAPSSQLAVISSNREQFDNQYWGIYQPIMTALNELDYDLRKRKQKQWY